MKNVKKQLMFVLAMACFTGAADARRNELRHEDIFVAKGATSGDVVTDKSITVDGVLDGDAVSVGGASVTVNGEITGDLISLGGAVTVRGSVKDDVISIGGPINVSGRVGGNITDIGAKVELSGTGQVDGDISSLGGTVVKGEKAVHKGQTQNFDVRALRTTLPRVLKILRYSSGHENIDNPWLAGGLIGGLVGLGLFLIFSVLITGVILLLLPAVFFPKNVENAAAAISGDIWRACGIGALIMVCLFPGLLVLVVSVMGIPLVPFALILAAAAAVLGLSAFSVVLQQRFFEGIKKAGPVTLYGKVATGYAIMAGLLFFGKLIPFIGGILSLIGAMLMAFGVMMGLGSVWMTKMGSRAYVPAQQPAAQPAVQPVAVAQPAPPQELPPAKPE
ncbi:MAG: hypothetical protein NTY45_05505 [Elusimicrobia bacterium]|nr:hypothetical protein [Elusimicrobiota bacterium]